jgi:uncharacterized protein (UPF0332 family)
MSSSWTQFFLLAEELSGATVSTSCGTEAKFRSAVSRAYYSAFCEARNYLISRGVNLSGQTPEIHKTVREEFRRRPNQTSRKIGADLSTSWQKCIQRRRLSSVFDLVRYHAFRDLSH